MGDLESMSWSIRAPTLRDLLGLLPHTLRLCMISGVAAAGIPGATLLRPRVGIALAPFGLVYQSVFDMSRGHSHEYRRDRQHWKTLTRPVFVDQTAKFEPIPKCLVVSSDWWSRGRIAWRRSRRFASAATCAASFGTASAPSTSPSSGRSLCLITDIVDLY